MNKDSKIYVAGHRGMVGSAIVRELNKDAAIIRRPISEIPIEELINIIVAGGDILPEIDEELEHQHHHHHHGENVDAIITMIMTKNASVITITTMMTKSANAIMSIITMIMNITIIMMMNCSRI